MPAFSLEIITLCLGIALLAIDAFSQKKSRDPVIGKATALILILLIGVIPLTTPPSENTASWPIWQFYKQDSLTDFFKGFFLFSTAISILLASYFPSELSKKQIAKSTYPYLALLVLTCTGMMWLASANDLISLFISLELVTISSYILVAFKNRCSHALEAGIKYLILGALSTGFLVFGIAWLYGLTGTTSLPEIAALLQTPSPELIALKLPLHFAFVWLTLSFVFKLGAFPLHFWVPDVYQGTSIPTFSFLSLSSKAAGLIAAIHVLPLFLASPLTSQVTSILLTIIIVATLLFGNLPALFQTNFRRLFAYSSLAHSGFLILALLGSSISAYPELALKNSVVLYLSGYLLINSLIFIIFSFVSYQRNDHTIMAFRGLNQSNPFLAALTAFALASLAGLPLTLGFWGKFYVLLLTIHNSNWLLLSFAVIGAICGFCYYLRIIRLMYWVKPQEETSAITLPLFIQYLLLTLSIAILVLGLFPHILLS